MVMVNSAYFIETEPLEKAGEAGEKLVWNAVRGAFSQQECLGYWRYPIFSQQGKYRKEPDILLADRQLGLIIIEVKSIAIAQILNISGHQWEYQNYYTPTGNPYQQAENQLFTLLEYCDREPLLKNKVMGRALIALPLITESEWQKRGFHQLPSNPPILFKNNLQNNLQNKHDILAAIAAISSLRTKPKLNQEQWKLLLSILAGTPLYCKQNYPIFSKKQNRGQALIKLKEWVSEVDMQQERIAKQIPPGCQRIRGIAGSGKSVILCQKAAHIHLKYPQWKIALVFFSRSLYQPILEQLDRWLRYFSNDEVNYDPKNRNLLILHAWGSRKQPGFYSTLAWESGVPSLSANQTESKQPNEALAEACIHLLKEAAIPQLFDAILIDEGQDLISDRNKFEDKQPFYWLAYQSLRPTDPIHPQKRRLIWAYDEAQSLESLRIPSASELFGEDLGHLVTGRYLGGIKKSEILCKCYRIPHLILTAAHGIAMGLLRPQGMLTGATRKEEWQAIGYEVTGKFYPQQKITLHRPPENSPNPIAKFWQGANIEFQIFRDRQQELSHLAHNLIHNLRYDHLRPSQQILVIVLGQFFEATQLETHVANFLMQQGLDIYIPSTSDCNILKSDRHNYHPDRFWWEGAITVSRIHRAKGHEADMVYIIGLDGIAKNESNIALRNQLFVALTRTRAWVNLSGIGSYPFYEEFRQVLRCGDTFNFTYKRPPQRELSVTDAGELLERYRLGRRNFRNADLENIQLPNACLKNVNLIGANLRGANLENTDLEGAKLIAADLTGAILKGANLHKTKLMQANLTRVDFQDVDLSSVILEIE
ncbi:pentapeptide repeat-containing protein [Spirulina sp. 06S082]|uniref:pentapeptide repeat-containing protein n=1 Tax=Spirulina sp. 06S082 TaxID=3110248 RepID=UPI002B1F7713|nr:pentapeptide repeat-containing protein [Spirulina sp. 06S082]MEA5470438.1 pentapeptide repeat-containing protein [Spirulina sp. 06S082]